MCHIMDSLKTRRNLLVTKYTNKKPHNIIILSVDYSTDKATGKKKVSAKIGTNNPSFETIPRNCPAKRLLPCRSNESSLSRQNPSDPSEAQTESTPRNESNRRSYAQHGFRRRRNKREEERRGWGVWGLTYGEDAEGAQRR